MKMNEAFMASMHEAMRLVQNADLAAATEVIQRALGGHRPAAGGAKTGGYQPAQVVQALLPKMQEAMEVLAQEVTGKGEAAPPVARSPQRRYVPPTHVGADAGVGAGGHFTRRTFSNHAGRRAYKLYQPRQARPGPMPLVVMLHGCTQDADDFAAGTRMNALAERHGFMVAYPEQSAQANHSKCWNWFKPDDQRREAGEPALIAGITREILAHHNVDARRVYVAGLSAGGAMAAVMVETYPDLYAAAGIHSGLAFGCAHDIPSAFAAMKGGKGSGPRAKRSRPAPHGLATPPVRPLIVFQGDADATVHMSNAERLLMAFGNTVHTDTYDHGGDGMRGVMRRKLTSADGVEAEYWLVHGAPHAWAGGSPEGSYTDARGPNASEEMIRFFFEHPQEP